jgi:hypothetical protein
MPPGTNRTPVEHAVTIATAAAALGAYLYVLGGVVTWLHAATAGLPGDMGVAAVDNTHLLSVGLRVAGFEAILLVIVSVVEGSLTIFSRSRRETPAPPPGTHWRSIAAGWKDLWTVGGMIALAFPLLVVAVGLSTEQTLPRSVLVLAGLVVFGAVSLARALRPPPKNPRTKWGQRWRGALKKIGGWIGTAKHGVSIVQWLAIALAAINVAVAVIVVPALQGVLLLAATVAIYAGPFLRWPDPRERGPLRRELLRSSGVWLCIAGLTAVAVAWVATPPVAFTSVRVTARLPHLPGAYVGSHTDGFSIATCDKARGGRGVDAHRSSGSRLTFIPRDGVDQISLGGPTYEFDPGGRPSLGQLALGILQGHGVLDEDAPLSYGLRGRSTGVCGS